MAEIIIKIKDKDGGGVGVTAEFAPEAHFNEHDSLAQRMAVRVLENLNRSLKMVVNR